MEEVEDPVSPHITESWIMLISEQHRYQGVSYKSDITLISGQHTLDNYCIKTEINFMKIPLGLDQGDRQALERKYCGYEPPCLLDSSDGRSDYIRSVRSR